MGEKISEKFFWADQIAEQIIKERGNKKEYVCAAGGGPSGTLHIGNFRDVITAELVARALINKGKKVRFIYSWDDYDRFRKVPKNVPKKWEKYIGMPINEFPSSFDKNKKYAEYFEKEFENGLKKVYVKPEFIQQSKMNKKCAYAVLIKKAIDKRKEIINILNKSRKEDLGENWWPFTIYCSKCKKDFTKVLDVKDYKIEYECKCGYKEKFDYRKKGIVKLRWRIDWPARWDYEKVDFEPGGIDLSVEGGSFMTGREISKKIFDYNPPAYVFYEWIKLKGGKSFSSSAGNVITIDEVEELYEPEILRNLFVSTRPRKSFQISLDADIIKEYEEFDDLERRYFEKEVNQKEKRIYELSQIKIPKRKPNKTSFKHLITLVQLNKLKGLNAESKKRAEKVKKWLENHAPEDFKFEFQKKIKVKLNNKEKQALIQLKEALATKKYAEDKLFNEFYNICKGINIKTKEFFQVAYSVLINKTRGPRLASLILAIGQDKVVKLLEKIE